MSLRLRPYRRIRPGSKVSACRSGDRGSFPVVPSQVIRGTEYNTSTLVPCQTPGIIGSMRGLIGLVSVYCENLTIAPLKTVTNHRPSPIHLFIPPPPPRTLPPFLSHPFPISHPPPPPLTHPPPPPPARHSCGADFNTTPLTPNNVCYGSLRYCWVFRYQMGPW